MRSQASWNSSTTTGLESAYEEVLVWQHRNCNGRYVPIRFVALHFGQLHYLAPGVVAAITKLFGLTIKNF